MSLLGNSCTSKTCPEMESDGQRFLCAAHAPPRDCCAVDYMCHTIDKATAFVHNTTLFPGRMDVSKKASEQFGSQVRRLYRILLHCYSAHRDLFDDFEESKVLCRRFTLFALTYKFLDEETLTIPVDSLEKPPSSDEENTASSSSESGEEEESEASSQSDSSSN